MSGPGDLDSDDFDTEDWEERAEFDDGDDEGADDDELANCGMMSDGTCLAAGSEDCDFDCPLGPMRNPGACQ
jgi:hypothetical protein